MSIEKFIMMLIQHEMIKLLCNSVLLLFDCFMLHRQLLAKRRKPRLAGLPVWGKHWPDDVRYAINI